MAARATPRFEGAREFPQGTRTAQDAAAAIGCDVAQICKSLVFRVGDRPLLVVASGAHRVDEARLEAEAGARPEKADAAFVREHTGFAIGGVPPYGHAAPIRTLVDEHLLGFDVVWAAAGTPTRVFPLTPAELVERTSARVVRIA